jgi:hypothetical protein
MWSLVFHSDRNECDNQSAWEQNSEEDFRIEKKNIRSSVNCAIQPILMGRKVQKGEMDGTRTMIEKQQMHIKC